MGKPPSNKGKPKNVFKVAGAKSLKTKNKAKPVSSQLKKLSEEIKKKTEDVDKLMNELQTEVRTQPKSKIEKGLGGNNENKLNSTAVEKVKEEEKNSEDVLNKISEMDV